MSYILIKNGSYRNNPIKNKVFPVIKNIVNSKTGSFVTVDGSKVLGEKFAKIRVSLTDPSNAVFVEQDSYDTQLRAINTVDTLADTGPVYTDSADEQRMNEIETRFDILNEMTGNLKSGDIRAMIVTGPPGVGKSYGVTETLEQQSMFEDISGATRKFEVVKGAMTALGLYAKLYQYSAAGSVLVFDDCDSVLMDDLALNILKAALDSGKKRKIFWNADSHRLRQEGIPDEFEFKGSACFITNIKFENVKSKRLQDHLEALQSRCHYLDLTLDTMRDKVLRIKQIARTGKLFTGSKFTPEDEAEVLEFMETNKHKFREMSLRMVLKVSDLKKISKNWRVLAESTCMRRS
jgi:hypothetical protein